MTTASTIDIHAHYFPESYLKLIAEHGKRCGTTVTTDGSGATFIQVGLSLRTGPITSRFIDHSERLAAMDRQGVRMRALSLTRGFQIRGECKTVPRKPSEYLNGFTYDTISYSEDILQDLIKLVGTERIMMGSDYCFDIAYEEPVKIITRMKSLSAEQRSQILWGNAARLLRL